MKSHLVKSRSQKGVVHTVEVHDTFETCTCEAFKFRHNCQHIKFIISKYYGSKN
jgi:hypothetical protein